MSPRFLTQALVYFQGKINKLKLGGRDPAASFPDGYGIYAK